MKASEGERALSEAEGGRPDVAQVKAQIEEEKKGRASMIDQLRRLRNKLNYKQAEFAALSKLSELSKAPKSLGRLKRLKSDIEFKISTEASTLDAERELIKRLNDINVELEEALKAYRFRRKTELVQKDIEDITKALESYRTQVVELDKRLDVLYAKLRELTGWKKKEEKKPKRVKQTETFEVSLEDIATIKGKKENK